MKNADVPECPQQTFVVTAVFMTQTVVKARSESEALKLCEEGLVLEGAESKDLCNWYAHGVNA